MSMNVSPHIPQVVVNSASPATESLARANVMKEVVPAVVQTEAVVPQKSREQDTRSPANQTSNSTYDDIQINRPDPSVIPSGDENAQDESTSEQNAQEQASAEASTEESTEKTQAVTEQDDVEQQERAEKQAEQEQIQLDAKQIQQLQQRDSEVKAHEQAHAAIGGSYASAPSYEYQTGPNGKKYAVGGEVSIDVSKEATPEDTIRKMQTVHAAALAPAEPSAQDRKVAAQAVRNIADARAELIQDNSPTSNNNQEETSTNSVNAESDSDSVSSNNDDSLPNKMSLAKNAEQEEQGNNSVASNKTVQVISNRYANATVPYEQGFSIVA